MNLAIRAAFSGRYATKNIRNATNSQVKIFLTTADHPPLWTGIPIQAGLPYPGVGG